MWMFLSTLLVQSAVEATRHESEPVVQVGSWVVFKNSQTAECRMAAKYEQGTAFLVYYNLASGRADFTFANDKWKSLRAGQKKQLSLTFFPRGEWARGEAGVVTSKTDDSVALSLGFADGSSVLKYLSEATSFSLTADGVSLGISNLDGSRKAVEALRACAAKAFAEGAQGDPFSRQEGAGNQSERHPQQPAIFPPKTWLQLGITTRDPATMRTELQDIRRKGGELIDGLALYVAQTVEGSRILIGPFRNLAEASAFAGDLRSKRLPSELWISPAGATVIRVTPVP